MMEGQERHRSGDFQGAEQPLSEAQLAELDYVTGLRRDFSDEERKAFQIGEDQMRNLNFMRKIRGTLLKDALPVPALEGGWDGVVDRVPQRPASQTLGSQSRGSRALRWFATWQGVVASSVVVFLIVSLGMFTFSGVMYKEEAAMDMVSSEAYNDVYGELPSAERSADSKPTLDSEVSADFTAGLPQGSSLSGAGLEPLVTSGLSLVRDVDLTLVAEKPMSVADSVRELVTLNGGFVVQLYRDQGDGDYLTMEVKVPSASLDAVVNKIRGFGELASIRESTQDVSGQIIDYGALLAESRDYLSRLEKLKEEGAGNSSLESQQKLEQELRNTRREVERYDRTLKSLNARVAFATISLEIMRSVPDPEESGVFSEAWDDGVGALENVLAFLLRALLATLPITALFVGIALFLRYRRRKS